MYEREKIIICGKECEIYSFLRDINDDSYDTCWFIEYNGEIIADAFNKNIAINEAEEHLKYK